MEVEQNLSDFVTIAKEQGIEECKVIDTRQLLWDFRTTYKCRTCSKYGKVLTCPPFIPDVDYFKRLLLCYKNGLVLVKHFKYSTNEEYKNIRESSGPRLQQILLDLENSAFRRGFHWVVSFTGGSCRMCKNCNTSLYSKCQTPTLGRIPMEATGIDVMGTCKHLNIEVTPFPLDETTGIFSRVGLFLLE